jgi:uncharacterized damage-inducible protein DinB
MAADFTSLLEETLEAWEYCREGIVEEVENIPEEEWDFRPAPESRSVRELVRHIVESGLMAAGELARLDGDFRRQAFPDFIREYAGHVAGITNRGELIELLRDTRRDGDRRFREAGELHMLQFIHRFDGQPGTRLAWLHHAVEHEMYHRGQLALYARLLGRVPALTQRIG